MDQEMNGLLKKQGVINGVLLGLLVTALSIFKFYYLTKMVTSMALVLTGYFVLFPSVLPVGLAVYFILQLRKKIGGYWNFRQAVTGIFIIFLAAYVIKFVFSDVLFVQLIEPKVIEKTEQALFNDAQIDFKKRNVSQKEIDLKIKEIKASLVAQKDSTIGQQVQGVGINVIFLFVLALIFAGFFKRELIYHNPNQDSSPV
jgi:hypothetical protein